MSLTEKLRAMGLERAAVYVLNVLEKAFPGHKVDITIDVPTNKEQKARKEAKQ